jgi:hypothetical protein
MARKSISLNLFKLTYGTLATLAQAVHDGFVTLAADYPSPKPTMLLFQTQIDNLNAAIIAWGTVGARGSHVQHLALIAAANVVRDSLRQLAAYAMTTKPDNQDSWAALGFAIKRPKSAPVPLQQVQNFHNFVSRTVVAGTIKLKWKRPLDTDASDVKGYIVQHSNTSEQPLINGSQGIVNVLGITTDTNIIVEPQHVGANYFWVTPFNSVGYGVSSAPVFYNAPAAA